MISLFHQKYPFYWLTDPTIKDDLSKKKKKDDKVPNGFVFSSQITEEL